MKEYTLSQKTRQAFAKNEPAVKAAIATIANSYFYLTEGTIPEGIDKSEGGVCVNGSEVAIYANAVINGEERIITRSSTRAETAVVEAISQVAKFVETQGIETLEKKYGQCKTGDPLRSLIQG